MVTKTNRVTHKIEVPSFALSKVLRQAIFDAEAFAVFMENTSGALKNNGVELGSGISDDALMRLRFLVDRARNYVVKQKINSTKFEELFGVEVVNARSDVAFEIDTDTDRIAQVTRTREGTYPGKISGSADVYYSEKQSESHRGASTEWKNQDALTESRSDHWTQTNFEGRDLINRPEERFVRTPLLDALTLGKLLGKMDIRLRELGS